ncbi:CoB--CoM heterodisulfide reductase iron-sulfur subunit A [Methanocella paludicola SANAE]|uniref:CoB--CoM heterodisulfide reductase iron-sulfur subunit A n=1 Tax=Methanocella paludicola (strain DSM 17711 / JCM 13418 / NBRC 101707 / SANAE) TaxID=304371 RepID=D1YYX6_METPS|nr:CoB--CoM heterodisulfide reductase iron-sulfur subunit A family protein [Methanocella paludicola]BAI61648.1 CoB--CoM heterodisulfide reductase iron-sulfur subunit A [Methanocella paludicola SANAE]
MTEKKPNRVGVFICHCGTNIAGVIPIEELKAYAKTLPNVVHADNYTYMCSTPGQEKIRTAIKEQNLDAVVVAACSPRLHEPTFRKASAAGGLNMFIFEMANIREQSSWIHMKEPEKATQKAKDIIRMSVARASLLEPLDTKYIPVEKSIMVIGAGVAGIQASLEIADSGITTYLIEKEPSIGGNMSRLDKTFPTLDCSQCILTPKMVDVDRHPNIKTMTYCEVEKVDGYIGNFTVTVRKKARGVKEADCNGCGDCAAVCPVTKGNEFDLGLGPRKAIYVPFPQAVPLKYTVDFNSCIKCELCVKKCGDKNAIDLNMKDELVEIKVGTIVVAAGFDLYEIEKKEEWGYGRFDNVITGMQFERFINASGPTGGKLIRPSDGQKPHNVAFVLCAGSRDQDANPYCSRVCCMYSLKHAHQIMEKMPGVVPWLFYMDIRAFGKAYEEFYYRIQDEGAKFVRGRVSYIEEDPATKNLIVHAEDTLLGTPVTLEADVVVLASAIVPKATTELLRNKLTISRSPDKFLLEAHPKLNPFSTSTDGIFLAGCCQGPKDIPDTVAQAAGAAAAAQVPINQGKVALEPIAAKVSEELCAGCGICEAQCPYKAISMVSLADGKRRANVNDAMCKGCGTCGATCPGGAIKMQHFTTPQIVAQIDAFLLGGGQ